MDTAPLPVLAVSEAGFYIYENEAARRFLGYEHAEIIGKQLKDLLAYDQSLITTTLEHLKRKGHLSGRARYRHADGSLREADVNIFGQVLTDGMQVFVTLVHPVSGVSAGLSEPYTSPDLGLSNAEMRLLQLLADGFSDQQVARLLGDKEDAIDQQVRGLLAKMNASSRTEAVVLALKKRVLL